MSKETLFTPPKNYVNKSSILGTYSSPHDNMNIDNPTDQMDVYLREKLKSTVPIILYITASQKEKCQPNHEKYLMHMAKPFPRA